MMLCSVKNRASGFTLIEMLIGIIILGSAISLLSMSISQSVRQQEKMDTLLDIYQIALTVKPQIKAEMATGQLSGNLDQDGVTVSWQANVIDERTEAQILNVETGGYQSANRRVYLYQVEVWIESQAARRVFSFKLAQKEANKNSNSPFDPRNIR